jgi:tRNA pseudouridine38-40 synthase
MNYRVCLRYDGTNYNGYQKLGDNDNTIQSKVESILSNALNDNINLIASGRTDKGVHAINQWANFHSVKEIDKRSFLNTINKFLPNDISIMDLIKVDDAFHSRFSAESKTYQYRLYTGKIMDPFLRRYVYQVDSEFSMKKAIECSQLFIGTHDFSAFTNMKMKNKSKIRTINSIDIFLSNDCIYIEINGNGFLHNMVRILIGTIIDYGLNKYTSDDILNILESKTRANASEMVPANALFLKEVFYE